MVKGNIQQRTFFVKVGMTVEDVKNSREATSLQKKYASAFDTDGQKGFSQREADLFNATTFSEKEDGFVIFWTQKKDGTKQGTKFDRSNNNIKFKTNLDVKPYNQEKSTLQNIWNNAKDLYNSFKTEMFSSVHFDDKWTKNYNWSEGCNRRIENLFMHKDVLKDTNLRNALKNIGQKVGFNVVGLELDERGGTWAEDYCIRRADGKIYILPQVGIIEDDSLFTQSTKRNSLLSRKHAKLLNQKNIVVGKSYLEGGNVLNTRLKNGRSAAIIGEDSIGYSLKAMKLDDTPENKKIVINQIAEDLGLNPKDITFIPQLDFHIDMFYRPLQDGVVAIPDYEEAINILKNNKISGMDNDKKEKLIEELTHFAKVSSGIRKEVDETLKKAGYTVCKIPSFSLRFARSKIKDIPQVNYQNGVCATSKDGKPYIILNESPYKELDNIIAEYYKKSGITEVYFVPTQEYLKKAGGIDCLTQEN